MTTTSIVPLVRSIAAILHAEIVAIGQARAIEHRRVEDRCVGQGSCEIRDGDALAVQGEPADAQRLTGSNIR